MFLWGEDKKKTFPLLFLNFRLSGIFWSKFLIPNFGQKVSDFKEILDTVKILSTHILFCRVKKLADVSLKLQFIVYNFFIYIMIYFLTYDVAEQLSSNS